jgi:hypothetical protein
MMAKDNFLTSPMRSNYLDPENKADLEKSDFDFGREVDRRSDFNISPEFAVETICRRNLPLPRQVIL